MSARRPRGSSASRPISRRCHAPRKARSSSHLGDADLHELAGLAATRLRPQYDDKGVTLEVVDGTAVPVRVDRDRIIQVLTNLLGNALTYTPPGGRVVVRTEAARRHVASATVSDNGVGIAAADLPLVFERFFRVPGLDRPPGGSGIGLTVAAGIAHAHHGDIRAELDGLGRGLHLHPRPSARRATRR